MATGDDNKPDRKSCIVRSQLWISDAFKFKVHVANHKEGKHVDTNTATVIKSEIRSRCDLMMWWCFIHIGFVVICACLAAVITSDAYETDNVSSVVTTKILGTLYNNDSEEFGGDRTWDITDVAVPPGGGPGEFFIMTRVMPRLLQTQTTCDEFPTVKGIGCLDDADCLARKGTILKGSHGPITGSCVNSTFPGFNQTKVCEIYGWCPVRDKTPKKVVTLLDTETFTVLIKNDIEFPAYDKYWSNYYPSDVDDKNVWHCVYNASHPRHKFCPIFTLKSIVEGAGENYSGIATEGGVIRININWECDMDVSLDQCVPTYTFTRLDIFDRGYDLSFSSYKNGSRDDERDLIKAFGIRFLVNVKGYGKKFSVGLFFGAWGQYLGYSFIPSCLFVATLVVCGYSQVDSVIRTNTCKQLWGCMHDDDIPDDGNPTVQSDNSEHISMTHSSRERIVHQGRNETADEIRSTDIDVHLA